MRRQAIAESTWSVEATSGLASAEPSTLSSRSPGWKWSWSCQDPKIWAPAALRLRRRDARGEALGRLGGGADEAAAERAARAADVLAEDDPRVGAVVLDVDVGRVGVAAARHRQVLRDH